VFGAEIKLYAQPPANTPDLQEKMKDHIEKVKLKNPQKYQEMVQKAGENITQCTDCHKEVIEGNHQQTKDK
jgi:hypothetical protein